VGLIERGPCNRGRLIESGVIEREVNREGG
jgi:hypothetical protein